MGLKKRYNPYIGFNSIFKINKQNLPIVTKPGFYDWIGDHRPDGVIFMYGENIRSNYRVNASVVDIVPTILSVMNIPISNDIDGRVIEEVFVKKPQVTKVDSDKQKEKFLTEAELKKIKKLKLK